MNEVTINRDYYLNALIRNMNNNFIKVVTGMRRSGKSFLLNTIFKDYLKNIGIPTNHIISINLDYMEYTFLDSAQSLYEYIMNLINDEEPYYIMIDEIQNIPSFEKVLISLLDKRNIDVYVTGSNSKFLSRDIVTEFRGRSKEIYLLPLSYKEFSSFKGANNEELLNEYVSYGGLPEVVLEKDNVEKSKLLKSYYNLTYIKDIVERYKVKRADVLEELVHILSSSLGSLTNPLKIYNTYKSKGDQSLSINTINAYLDYLENSFMVSRVKRFDIGERKSLSGLSKYYFTDLGIRNSLLSFQDSGINHAMENLVYNEMRRREFDISIGIVELKNEGKKQNLEIDFICEKGNQKYYIQVAANIDDDKTREREFRPLFQTNDYYRKILVIGTPASPHHNEKGILVVNIKDFLTDESIIDL